MQSALWKEVGREGRRAKRWEQTRLDEELKQDPTVPNVLTQIPPSWDEESQLYHDSANGGFTRSSQPTWPVRAQPTRIR